ncbi:unnamed protein product [Closterium sp. NIES-65]|nr:unnamed protein product [Closterium sp. NIES-65]
MSSNLGSIPESTFPAWSHSVQECLDRYQVDADKGLDPQDVAWRRSRFGFNELEKEPGTPFWKLVVDQFNDTLVKILLAAAAVSFVLAYVDEQEDGGITAYVEPLVILLILVLNACVGVWQESNAERALEALKDMQSETAKVVRAGEHMDDLPARELVPGDIVELRVGDKVPADMRVISLLTSTLRLEQASLTGESMAVQKSANEVQQADCELQAKESMVFAGTTVVNGSSRNLVIATGMNTEIGKIQQQIAAAAAEEDDTPLKKKLDEFGERLTTVIGVICLLVWLINYKFFLSWKEDPAAWWTGGLRFSFSFQKCTYYFKIAVALAVAAIPEGLPAVITTCLALGTRKMAQKNAIVRKLPSVETLGCTTVICSDKTGTLTTNQMAVSALVLPGTLPSTFLSFAVDGTSYNPADGEILNWGRSVTFPNTQSLTQAAVLCNDASISLKGGAYRASGLPTEAALRVLVEKIGVPDDTLQLSIRNKRKGAPASHLQDANEWWGKQWERKAVLEFDRSRKSMSVIVRSSQGKTRLLVKGAVESVLERCTSIQLADGSIVPLTSEGRRATEAVLTDMASKALRCLAFACKEGQAMGALQGYSGEQHEGHKVLLDPGNYERIEQGLVFCGMVGLRDPPREEVPAAVEDCRAAGIRVMVITGDNKNTAEAICREIGVLGPSDDLSCCSFTGKDFMDLPAATRMEILKVPGGKVFWCLRILKNLFVPFKSWGEGVLACGAAAQAGDSAHAQGAEQGEVVVVTSGASVPGGKVFSRAEPRHKQEIVRMLKEQGEVVAMTGDGVNDAPALKLADIGIAMGIAGTEVAKQASDMALAYDIFSTIVAAFTRRWSDLPTFFLHPLSMHLQVAKQASDMVLADFQVSSRGFSLVLPIPVLVQEVAVVDEAALNTPEERARRLGELLRKKREEQEAIAAAARAEAEKKAAEEEAARRFAEEKIQAQRLFVKPELKPSSTAAPPVKEVKQQDAKKSKRGGMPLFVSQFGVLAAFGGGIAALFVLPDEKWKEIEEGLEEVKDFVVPIVDDVVIPFAEAEFAETAKPYAEAAIDAAKPVAEAALEAAKPVAEAALEAAKPVAEQAVEKVKELTEPMVSQVEEQVNKVKDVAGPVVSQVGESVEKVKEAAGPVVSQVQEKTAELIKSVEGPPSKPNA